MKIYLVDNSESGHHRIYQDTLNKIENTKKNNFILQFDSIKQNPIKALKKRKQFIEHVSSGKVNIIHFLYLDSLYKCPFIDKSIANKNYKYIGTLHWIPTNKLNKLLLKRISKKLEYIIVHSEFLKNKLLEDGIKNVIYIDYPSFITSKSIKKINNNNKIIISCLGGTRADKGLDVLIDSFKYIHNEIKNKVVFNICGKEQDIKYEDIRNEANKYNINVILKNKFLSDEEYEGEIVKSDIILLPYKKIFSGNSGPMTDGIYLNKFIIGPNYGNLGYLIDKHNLGETFEIENPRSLAKTISNINNYDLLKKHKYAKELSVEEFLMKYKNIYDELSR